MPFAGYCSNIAVHRSPEINCHVIRQHIVLLPRFAADSDLLVHLPALLASSPQRKMLVPGGGRMSVAISNCGALGWISDQSGYRYSRTDPETGHPWPTMPRAWRQLAQRAAAAAGLGPFEPDACLINRYESGARLGLHRDQDESDYDHPVVSVSFGSSARFVVGGLRRSDPTEGLMLHDGDVLVWGASQRLVYHGVGVPRNTVRQHDGSPAQLRINLTFRKAGEVTAPPGRTR